jgi:signal transduction histidine kinase
MYQLLKAHRHRTILCGCHVAISLALVIGVVEYHQVFFGVRPQCRRTLPQIQCVSESRQMRLATFIREREPSIVEQWEIFAKTLVPASDNLSPRTLRNHIKDMLAFITNDIESSQTSSEQMTKSEGRKPKNFEESAAEIHASLRQSGGFTMDQMISEFRALRASVIRLWEAQLTEANKLDLSDLIRFNESLDQVITEATSYYTKTSDHSRDLFLGILGHDLRNPIGAMEMSAKLALTLGANNDRQRMLVSQIVSSAGRATEIIDHLLDLTRARLGSGFQVIKKDMDMAFVSRQMVDEMRALHPGRTFKLEISGETEGRWDKARIGQVFSNLLGNAVQYGFTDLPIGVTIKGELEAVVVSVHNDGVPIPVDAIGGIFDSLTRARGEKYGNDGDSTNLGLGLYITKEKDGTTFTALFPR